MTGWIIPSVALGVRGVFTVVTGVPLGVFCLFRLPAIWRNETGLDSDVPPLAWPWSVAYWRAWVRTGFLGGLWFLPGVVFVLVDSLDHRSGVLTVLHTVLGVYGSSAVLLSIPVILFNWPKWVVPPHVRHQPGLIAEWRGERPAPTPPPERLGGWQVRNRARAAESAPDALDESGSKRASR